MRISHNNIKAIDSKAFGNLKNLYHLYLDNNNISVLQSEIFNNLSELRELNLNNNKIETLLDDIFPSIFRSIYDIKNIQISNIKLVTSSRLIFSNNSKIESLDFSNN